eukprot:TRINITY_DN6239_c0_g1_i1.p1 TRINITY_DN6239_c0_g1~~TRINITY_DN6239_c0_g1_i1.p1  ORF type:complete len:137 (+),score=16.32 TRINITY_DN6239_c0_g1_i1:54-464(+)
MTTVRYNFDVSSRKLEGDYSIPLQISPEEFRKIMNGFEAIYFKPRGTAIGRALGLWVILVYVLAAITIVGLIPFCIYLNLSVKKIRRKRDDELEEYLKSVNAKVNSQGISFRYIFDKRNEEGRIEVDIVAISPAQV